MKKILLIAVCASSTMIAGYSVASFPSKGNQINVGSDIVQHGGGCRKSSPPGQCCHKDHSTGIVHCH